jgi:hypothetical protein
MFNINIKNKEIKLRISYIYTDYYDKRNTNITPETLNDFTINEKYNALMIETSKVSDLIALSREIGHETFVKRELVSLFTEKLKETVDGSELKFLYENATDFILKSLLAPLGEKKLLKHLQLLTEYDDTGLLSGWKDGSSALINVLKVFGNSKTLYEEFKNNPAFVKRIYKNLDGESQFEEQLLSNKIVFSNLLYALCATNGFKDLVIVDKTFYYGDGYKFETNVTGIANDEKEEEFFIQQLREIPLFGADIIPLTEFIPAEDTGKMYHPFDMVLFVDANDKETSPLLVPAIFVKALSDENKKQEIETNIRIGFDLLAIIAGVVTVATTGNPGVLALAIADLGLATTDAVVQTFKKEIQALEGGTEFLNTWEKIYLAGGLATASPVLINKLLTSGPKLLLLAQKVKSFNALKFLQTSLLKVLLEIEIANFTKNTVRFLKENTEIVLETKGVLNEFKLNDLYKNGVLVVVGEVKVADKIENQVALIYRGEAIVIANKQNFHDASYDLLKKLPQEKAFFEACENLWKLIPKLDETKRFWVWENVAGTKMQKPYLTEKALLNKIKDTIVKNQPEIKGSSTDKLFEAEVGEEMFRLGKLNTDKPVDFANKINKGNIGEIDYSSTKYIVEAKTNLDNLDALKDLKIQLKRYLPKNTEIETNYLNAQNKTVVVVHETGKIDKVRAESLGIIKELEKDGVIFVDGIEKLKKLY